MKKLILTIPVLFAILVSATTSPAFAATKVTNTSIPFFFEEDFDGTICGITSNFHLVDSGQEFMKVWSNDHYKYHADENIVFTDNNNGGALVASLELSFNIQGNFTNQPESIQYNAVFVCADGTTLDTIHVGNTLHRDGTVTDHHISFI